MVKRKMLTHYFGLITDQRQSTKIKHKLTSILFIAVVATLANCDSWVAIEDFANDRIDFFKKYLTLPLGYLPMIPCKEFLNGLIQKNLEVVL